MIAVTYLMVRNIGRIVLINNIMAVGSQITISMVDFNFVVAGFPETCKIL